MAEQRVAAVVIGRNEGDRLIACLNSLTGHVGQIVYVDSGSDDNSVEAARDLGADVIDLDMSRPFSAARARNSGAAAVLADHDLVQFVDGDCIVQPEWIPVAVSALEAEPDLAVVCGRRREIEPQASVWNRLIDREWDTPIGEARACGGDAMMRRTAFEAVGGFNDAVVAGEEPELCVRLRASGWRIRRIDAEMVRHDAALLHVSQWWARTRRAGHAYAQGAALHGAPPERHYVKELRRALVWGVLLPALILATTLAVTPSALVLLLIYPLQILRLWRRDGEFAHAIFSVTGKFAEALGALTFYWNRVTGRGSRIIEYK